MSTNLNQSRLGCTFPAGASWSEQSCSLFVCSFRSCSHLASWPRRRQAKDKHPGIQVRVRFGPELSKTPLDGRLLVMLSTDPKEEPRLQINDSPKTQQIFGIDVDGLQPGQEAVIDASVLGYPVESLGQVPPGHYRIQALLHKYETFHRADGHVVKLPMDRGEGQQWNKAPGNLYSTPKEITIEAGPEFHHDDIHVELDKVIPPIPEPADHQVHQARADPERTTDQVLGPAHLPGGTRVVARRL